MPKAAGIPPAEAFDVSVMEQDYFHGLLPRDDVAVLLTKHGDFLIRLSEADTMGAKLETVLSVMHDPKSQCKSRDPEARLDYLMHIIIQSMKKKYYVLSYKAFDSIPDLITYYENHAMIFRSQKVELLRGVGLASWEFRADSVQLDQLISRFSCGEVRRGKIHRKDSPAMEVAVKTVAGRSPEAKEKVLELMAQCRLLNDLYHPCVVQYFGVCLIAQPNCFIFEHVSEGPLDEWLRNNRDSLKRDELLLMVMSAGWGLEYLHQNSILHRDIAAKNCLYDKQFAKLSGFGRSKKGTTYTMKTPRKMPIRWMAPETLQTYVHSQKSDVYTYGVLIYEIFALREPYDGVSNTDAKQLILDNNTLDFPGHMMNKLSEVVKEKMWAFDPEKRANMRQMMLWMQAYTGMELQLVGGETVSYLIQLLDEVTATVRQNMDALVTRDVELQSLPNFEEPRTKTPPQTPQRRKKKKK